MYKLKRVLSLVMIVIMTIMITGQSFKDVQAVGNPYLNYKSVYVVAGKTFKVKMLNVPKGAKIKWRTTNKKVATVKKGKIKGIGKGQCKIKAKYKKKTYTCKVKVQENLVVTAKKFTKVTLGMINVKMDVQRITFTDNADPIYAGKPGQFQLKVYNSKKSAKWKSSNENVATVSDKGLVIAKAAGTCKITATVAGKKVSCAVTVTDYQDPVKAANQKIVFEMLSRLNKDRIKVKARPLKMLDKLVEIADIRAAEISEKWSHERPNGQSFSTVYNQVGFKKGKLIGENIAYTADKPEDVSKFVAYTYNHLYNEKYHRENMLNPKYECIGIGYYDAGNMIGDFGELLIRSYWTQEFYTK